MYLYQASKDPSMLHIGASVIEALNSIAKTECGYAVVHNVETQKLANRMESFFLSETTKYLFLLFDEDNFIHNPGSQGTIVNTPNGQCVIDAGGYIFNTEAHPIDIAALDCCHKPPREQYHQVVNDIDLRGLVGINPGKRSRFLSQHDEYPEYKDIENDAGTSNSFTNTNFQKRRKRNILLTCPVKPFYSKFTTYGETIPE